jgi:hypothetical protein
MIETSSIGGIAFLSGEDFDKMIFCTRKCLQTQKKTKLAMFYYKCKVPFKYIKKFLTYDLNACALVFSLFI